METASINRRSFLARTAGTTVLLAGGVVLPAPRSLASGLAIGGGVARNNPPGNNSLRQLPAFTGGILQAEARKLELWPGSLTDVLALNGSVLGSTIRIMAGWAT